MSTESQQMLQFQREVYRRLDEMDRKHESCFNRLCEKLERKIDASLKMQEQMSKSQRKFFDEQELRLGEVKDDMCSRIESLNKMQENFQKQLSAHGIQTSQMQKDLKLLDYKEEFSRQASAQRQKLISHQLFQLVEVLNVLNYNVKFITDKCDHFQKATAEHIQNGVSERLQALEKILCGLKKHVQELVKGSSFPNPPGMPSSEGQHFTSASVEQGNLFLGDVTVQGQIIGQVDVRKVFESKKTKKIEIKNINHYTVNQLKEKASTRNRKPQDTRSTGPMTEVLSLERQTGPVAQPKMDEEMVVVLGGHESEGVVECYNASCDIWTTRADISDGPTKETLAVPVGDVIIIFDVSNKKTRSLDFTSKSWTDLQSPPVSRGGMKAAVDGNLVYLTGGDEHLTRCDVFNFQSNQWSEGPNLNVGRFYHGSATLEGKIYCCGGINRKGKEMASTEVLDPRNEVKGRWTSVAEMKRERGGFGLCSCSCFLWAVGGWQDLFYLKDLERYNPVSNIWIKMEKMWVERYHLSVCFFSGKLYAIGGVNRSRKTVNTVEAYDPEKSEWIKVAPLHQGRRHHASCVVQLPTA